MRKNFLLVTLVFFVLNINAQKFLSEENKILSEAEDSIAQLAITVIKDTVAANRITASEAILPLLIEALRVPNSFQYKFDKAEAISIQYPQDSSFRIFTWQLYVSEEEYRHFGAIQLNEEPLKLFPLNDQSATLQRIEYKELAPQQWYGSVYYNIHSVKHKGERYYMLFGFDGHSFFRKRKVVEVLRFREDGQPVFGAPVFVNNPRHRVAPYRLIREYSAEVSTRCNYDETLEMIIFDHLIAAKGPHGEGLVYYPDGSYEGYRYKKGVWEYEEKVFNQVSEEAPRPAPILDKRPKDLFGN